MLTNDEIKERALYGTNDPMVKFPTPVGPDNMPALTTLLYVVCQNDQEKFEEATRLVGLFIDHALALKDKG